MRCVLVGPAHPFRGGIAHHTTLLFRALVKHGHQAHLLSLSRQYPRLLFPGRTQEDESEAPLAVENERILSPLRPWSWWRTARRIVEIQPDLVVLAWWHPFFAPCLGTLARILARRRIPAIFLCHNVRPHEGTALDRVLSRYALGAGAGFVLHAGEEREALESLAPGKPIRVTPHPTYDVFRSNGPADQAAARRHLDLPAGRVVLFFGNIREYKGLPDLIEAMPTVRERMDCTLLVVGEFYGGRDPVIQRIRELGLEDTVRLVPRYVPNEEVGTYFEAADLVALPYRSATQSGIVQVAFAFEKPVVATRVGGIPEVVTDGQTGLLVPARDPAALASAILRFFQEDLGPGFTEAIRREADRFSWGRLVTCLEELAGELAGLREDRAVGQE